MASALLSQNGFESHRIEAELLAAHALGIDRSGVLAHPELEVPPETEQILERRLRGEPLAYILGYREFYGRRFAVDSRVLIPRQETETLVEAFLELTGQPHGTMAVLDLATGSGCIGITLALERPQLDVTLSDVSPEALEIAALNATTLRASVHQIQSDRFSNFGGMRFDAIVTNPPYIGAGETLPREVSEFEPAVALFAGAAGDEFYDRLAAESASHLSPGGLLLMEVGYTQSERVQALFDPVQWKLERVFTDLSGIERVLAYSNLE